MTEIWNGRLAVVSATLESTDLIRKCTTSWAQRSDGDYPTYTVKGRCGVVPLFAEGLARALRDTKADIIACLHDDVEIKENAWDRQVIEFFDAHPACGLLGFGGGTGLGSADIYHCNYNPMQLARQDFVSNMDDAEVHGRRARLVPDPDETHLYAAERVACLDGFSQIGRRGFWQGRLRQPHPTIRQADDQTNLFERLTDLGLVHHAYDAALGCYAKRLGWEVWMLPIACKHWGGQTAVGLPSLPVTSVTFGPCLPKG